ncbi:hypothetical protein JM946_14475 [Steroidobacter sp. S1-65]|uniref:PLL-like beta propeller domain-containing protein n=1 Tax=Steroidobacter gossypii TaxID=2805490 RepID=A0ABS1WY73_9GAMM|nr:hypothetical protein [Steroidobacter gossypii]MBM0105934.1 hypothetical protein [Steroidobacter gossypii]
MRNGYLSLLIASVLGMASTASVAAVCASNAASSNTDAAVAYSADGQVHIFHSLTNGNLVRRFGNPGNPAGLNVENLGGVAGSEPSAASWGPGHVATFLRGSNGALWYLQWDNGSYSNWQSLGGTVTWNPSVVATAPGQMTVFYRGANQQLYYLDYNGGWSGHQGLAGVLTSSPVAVSWGPGHVAVFTRGQANDIWFRQRINGVWGPWETLGGNFAGPDPAVASRGPGLIDVFMKGNDNQYYVRSYNGAWTPNWLKIDLPPAVFNRVSEPGATGNPNGTVTVFGRGMILQGHNGNPDTIAIFAKTSPDGLNWSASWQALQTVTGPSVSTTAANPEAAATGYGSWTVANPVSNGGPLVLCTGP